jgi:hypothetical protein
VKLKPALLIAAMVLMIYSCEKKSLDVEKPTFETPVTFSAQTSNAMTLNWVAKDDLSKDEDLSYKVVYSLIDNISTEADADANGTVLQDWALNVLTANMTALDMVTTYYVTVLVRDEKSNTAVSTGSSATLCTGKAIFLATVPNGNLGAPSGADTICAGQKPAGFASANFKAMVVDIATRRACYVTGNDNCSSLGTTGRLNWVLGPSRTYCSSDYINRVGTTDANSYLNVPSPNSLSSTTVPVYTGLNAFWGTSTENCSAFSSTVSTSQLGTPNGIENGTSQHSFITNGSGACTVAGKIYCVEQ